MSVDESNAADQERMSQDSVVRSTIHIKKARHRDVTWGEVLGPLNRVRRDVALIKLCMMPKMRFLADMDHGCMLKLSFLAQKERAGHSLYSILSPHNTALYARLYHGADYLGDAYNPGVGDRRKQWRDNSLCYCTTQSPHIPIVCARVYPHLGQTLVLTVRNVPRELMFPSSYSRYKFSRPMLRMAVCSLSAAGHINIVGNCYTHPLVGKHMDMHDLPDPVDPDALLFSADDHKIYIKMDMHAHSRLFLLFEFTFLADLRGSESGNRPLYEVSRGVGFLRLSPMEQFSDAFMDKLNHSLLSLPGIADREESKRRRRRAEDDFLRISDLISILEPLGCIQNEERLTKALRAAKKGSNAASKQRLNMHQHSPFGAISLEVPIFEFSCSDQLTTLINGTSYRRWRSKPSTSCAFSVEIKPIHLRDIGSISRLPDTIIVPPGCLFALDHAVAAYATMFVGPRSYLSQTAPQLGRLCVEPKVAEEDTNVLVSLLRSSAGAGSNFSTEIATLNAVLRSFGRNRPIITGYFVGTLTGSALLYFFAALFNVRADEVPADVKHYMNQSILPPVSLNITDNILLGTFLRFLRHFKYAVLAEMAAAASEDKMGDEEVPWDKEAECVIRLVKRGVFR